MISELKFGPWLPASADYRNPGLEEARNAIPGPSGFSPAYGAVPNSTAVTGTVLRAYGMERQDGKSVSAIATEDDIFLAIDGSVYPSGLSLTILAPEIVSFEQFGPSVYATARGGATYYLPDIEGDTEFVLAPGSPPSAMAIARVDDFLVMGNLRDIDNSTQPFRVRWSAFNNPTETWGTNKALQADFQDLDASQGPVVAISGGSFGIVFQRFGVSRMDYNGRASVFTFDNYDRNRGCAAPRSVARVGDKAYYLSSDGFYVTDGASTQSISRGRVWDWFLASVNKAFLEEVGSAVDWERRCVVWYYATGNTRDYTAQIWYNWETDTFGHVEQSVEAMLAANDNDGTSLVSFFESVGEATLGSLHVALGQANKTTTLQGGHDSLSAQSEATTIGSVDAIIDANDPGRLEAVFGIGSVRLTMDALDAIYPSLDSIPFSLDDLALRPSKRTLGAVVNGQICRLDGATLEAELTTGSFQMKPGYRTFVRSVTPLVANEAEDTRVSVSTREGMTKSVRSAQEVQIGPLGFAPMAVDGRYFRATIRIPGGQAWSDCYGMQVEYEVSGAL